MILTVTMNPSIDISYPLSHLVIDDVNRIKDVSKTAGGKGLNVSRVIKLMDRQLTATGILGGHFGAFIETQLDRQAIKHSFTHINQETRHSIAILHDSGNQTEILEAGPTINKTDKHKFLTDYKRLLNSADLVTISGSLPQGLPDDFYAQMIALAEQHQTRVLLDTSGTSLKAALLCDHKPFLIKPNETEIAQLLNITITENDFSKLSKQLANPLFKDIHWIVISLGAAGALVKHNCDLYRVTIPKIQVKNPVGSGDATLAGLAIAISEQADPETTIKTAMTTGMLNTMEKKTGFVDKASFSEYFNQVKVVKL